MTMTRQRAGVSRMPMTSREVPLPGTAKRSKPVRRPAARKRAATLSVGAALVCVMRPGAGLALASWTAKV